MNPYSPGDPDLAARHEAALERLTRRINYERNSAIPYRGRGLKLDRMREFLSRLGDPHRGLAIIHVAGTKGKGSTAAMIAGMMTAAGKRVGLFTSPHLDYVGQRMAVDRAACTPEELVGLMDQVWPVVEAMDRSGKRGADRTTGPTYFEITTAMALVHFASRGVDAAVLEVGLGGRLDSTNVCQPLVSVITNISYDHTQQLGNTLSSIAREKAGIIKPGVPVVSGVVREEPRRVIRATAQERGCRLVEIERDFQFRYRSPAAVEAGAISGRLDFRYDAPGCEHDYADLELNLLGRHQGANAAVALATLAELGRLGWNLPEAALRRGLAGTTLPARIEIVARQPTIVVDAAHNVASVEALLQVLEESFACKRRTLVFATTSDKDIRGMLQALLPRFDEVVLTRYQDNPRGVSPQVLDALAGELAPAARQVFEDPAGAWAHVRSRATADQLIVVTGSFYIAAEMRRLIAQHPVESVRKSALEAV